MNDQLEFNMRKGFSSLEKKNLKDASNKLNS